jgi:hypothetical protein
MIVSAVACLCLSTMVSYWVTPYYVRTLLAVSKLPSVAKVAAATAGWLLFSCAALAPFFLLLFVLGKESGWLLGAVGAWAISMVPGIRYLHRHRQVLRAAGYF